MLQISKTGTIADTTLNLCNKSKTQTSSILQTLNANIAHNNYTQQDETFAEDYQMGNFRLLSQTCLNGEHFHCKYRIRKYYTQVLLKLCAAKQTCLMIMSVVDIYNYTFYYSSKRR